MAIYHLDLSTVRRSLGRSVIQLIAYITDTQLRDEKTGRTHRRASKDDYIETGEFGPEMDREALWNLAEKAERRKDAVVGRHVILALPHEVSRRKRVLLLQGMAERIHRDTNAPVVYAMHEDCDPRGKPRNAHGHIVLGARRWDGDEQCFGVKTRELDVPWTGGRIIEAWREDWENRVNCALPKGVTPISRLSHARAGRPRKPRKHLGDQACEIERRGGRSRAGDYNRLLDRLEMVQAETMQLTRTIDVISMVNRPSQALEKDLLIAQRAISGTPRNRNTPTAKKTPGAAAVAITPEPPSALLVPDSLQAELSKAEDAIASIPSPDGPQV